MAVVHLQRMSHPVLVCFGPSEGAGVLGRGSGVRFGLKVSLEFSLNVTETREEILPQLAKHDRDD